MTLHSKSVESFKCSVCGSTANTSLDGFIVCTNCGTCQDRQIVQGTYTAIEGLYSGSQFVDVGNKMHVVTANGSEIGYKRQSVFKTSKAVRLKRVHDRMMMRIEERLLRGLKWINMLAAQLNLSVLTRDRAAYLHRTMLPHYNIHKDQKPLVICVLTLAIREHQIPIKESQVLEIIPLLSKNKSILNRTKFFIMEYLGISWPSHRPECFIPQIISTLRKDPNVLRYLERRNGTPEYFSRLERITTKLLQPMTSLDYGSRAPDILAASAIYAVDSFLLKVLTQRSISKASGAVEFAIRIHHSQLWKSKAHLVKKLLEEEE